MLGGLGWGAAWYLKKVVYIFPLPTATMTTKMISVTVRRASGGVHPGVGRTLRKPVAFSQDRSASRTDGAEVRPYLPDQAAQMELAERHLCVQERCLKLIAVKHEVVRQEQLLRRRCRSLR